MFEIIRCAIKAFWGRRFDARLSDGARPSEQTCFTCGAFDYCDPDDVDGCDGYCGHPNHSDASKSPHYEYGGHWTSHDSWCQWWCETSATEMAERRSRRAAALRQAADAVTRPDGSATSEDRAEKD